MFKIGQLAPKLLGREKDRQAESLYRSYFSRKLVSDKAGKGLKRSPRLSGCPKAGAALPTPALTDVCLPCTRHWTLALGACPGDEKTSNLQTTWQAFPWAWHSISQHLETWEHLLSTQAEQGSVTSNPSIHIFTLCGWVPCHQLRNTGAGVAPHPLQTPLSSCQCGCSSFTPNASEPQRNPEKQIIAGWCPLSPTLLEWLCSNASTGAILSTCSGPKPVQHTTRPIPVMAIKDSLKTLHLSAARTVGDGSYSQRKGGLAGLSLAWCWVFSTPKTDHTGGSSELSDGSGIRITVMWEEASNPPLPDYSLPFIFSILLHPEIQLSSFQCLTIKKRGVQPGQSSDLSFFHQLLWDCRSKSSHMLG